MMKKLLFVMIIFSEIYADGINFDFVDARNKGYTDKEILDYVEKNLNQYDISSVRAAKLSDKEIVDFFIQRDSVNNQIKELSKNSIKMDTKRIYPLNVSLDIANGCLIYTGKKKQKDGWIYTTKLTDFARNIYTYAYLNEKDYYNIDNASGVSLRQICQIWLDEIKSNDKASKFYAVLLTKEITNIVKQKKALIID